MPDRLKSLVKKPARRVAEKARGFFDHESADRDARIHEAHQEMRREVHQLRTDIEQGYGSILEASTYLGRTLREVSARLEEPLLRSARSARTIAELGAREAELINFAESHLGFAAQAGIWLNPAILYEHREGQVRISGVNERILEIPYVLRAVGALEPGARILDVGAAESSVALSLASLGYRVTAIDGRKYPFAHPGLETVEALFQSWDGDGQRFEAAVALSSIEHFGLGAYGEVGDGAESDRAAIEKIRALLVPRGFLFLTVPFGKADVTPLQRTYDDAGLQQLLEGFAVEKREIGEQLGETVWTIPAVPSSKDCRRVALVTARAR